MLNKIRIQNFKCLREVEVDLTPLTVLIGPNDSGKSSFLTCLELFGKLANPIKGNELIEVDSIMRGNRWRLDQKLNVSMAASGTEPDFSLSVATGPAGRMQQLRVGGETAALTTSAIPHQLPKVTFRDRQWPADPNKPLLPQILGATGNLPLDDVMAVQKMLNVSEPYHFSPSEMRKPSFAEPKPVLTPRGENLASVVNSLLTGPDRTAVTELEHSLELAISTLKGVSTPAFSQDDPSRRVLEFTLSGSERPPLTIPASEVSDGAMFLTAFLALIHTQSTQVLLIEEPENGFHPMRLQTVVELLRKFATGELGYAPRQIVLTTHSPVLLNCVTPAEVRIFRRGADGATSVVRMDQVPDIDRLSKEYALGEMWFLFGEEDLIQKSSK